MAYGGMYTKFALLALLSVVFISTGTSLDADTAKIITQNTYQSLVTNSSAIANVQISPDTGENVVNTIVEVKSSPDSMSGSNSDINIAMTTIALIYGAFQRSFPEVGRGFLYIQYASNLVEMNWLGNPQWLAIFVSLLLGLVGIFQDWIRQQIWKPKLKVEFGLKSPCSQKIAARDVSTGSILYNVYQFRLRIKNEGNYQLQDVEAMATELTKRGPSGKFEEVNGFIPLNLVWSHPKRREITEGREITKPKIQPKMFKLLDFGHIVQKKYADIEASRINEVSEILLELDVEVKPNTGSYLIPPGEHRIKLIFGANNINPVIKVYSLIIEDKWTEDEEMLENYISIKEENSMY
jgi:hypothetical protein